MDNKWKDSLRERFSDYSVPEPEGLWEGIEQGLSGNGRTRVFPLWWLVPAAVAAGAAVLLLTGRGGTPSVPGEEVRPVAEAVVSASEGTDAVSRPEEGPFPTGEKAVVRKAPVAPRLAEASGAETVGTVAESREDPTPAVDTLRPSAPAREEKSVTTERPSGEEYRFPDSFPDGDFRTADAGPRRDRSGFSVGIYREGGPESSEASEGYGMVNTTRMMSRARIPSGESGDLVRMMSANQPSSFESRYQAPVRLGLSLSWHVSSCLSLSTGITRTSLKSWSEESAVSVRSETEQTLVYAGIPLQVQYGYDVWKRLRLYASAGAMGEKCVSASATVRQYTGNNLLGEERTSPDAGSALFWSAQAGAGIEYRVMLWAGVYFEPGLEYHFDNGSPVRSLYTEKPFTYSLTFGLRFHFGLKP